MEKHPREEATLGVLLKAIYESLYVKFLPVDAETNEWERKPQLTGHQERA